MLATLGGRARRAARAGSFEVKWDGYRAIAYVRGGECRLVSRNGNDLTARFADVARAVVKALKTPNAVLDGEVCALDEHGRPSFSAAAAAAPGGSSTTPSTCSRPTASRSSTLPLRERQAAARGAARPPQRDGRGSPRRSTTATRCSRPRRRSGLEGVMAKRADSPYRAGPPDARLAQDEDARPAGVRGRRLHARRGPARVEHRRARARASNEGGALRWVGNVGTGLGDAEIERLLELLRPLERADLAVPRAAEDAARAQGRRRLGRAEARRRGRVRRVDARRPPARIRATSACATTSRRREVRRERPARTSIRKGKRELRLTNLDKVFWPDEGITKGDLVDYYRQVAPVLVPHLRDRPFTMRRYPDGIDGQGVLPEGRARRTCPTGSRRTARSSRRASGEGEARGRVPARERRAGAALDGEHGLHRHEPVVLAGRPPRPARLRALRPRPDAGGAVVADDPGGAARARGCSSWSASSRSRRRRAARASTCSSPLDRRSTYDDARAFAELVGVARSCARTRSSRRGSGRRRAAAAC